jgi:hypothetical protein
MISHPAAYFHRGFLRAAKARLWGYAYPYRRAALRRVGLRDDAKARSVRRIAMQDLGDADAAALPTHRLGRCKMLEDQSRVSQARTRSRLGGSRDAAPSRGELLGSAAPDEARDDHGRHRIVIRRIALPIKC